MKVQKGIIILLVFIMVFSVFCPVVEAYPTNNGKWEVDYVNDLVDKYKLLTEEEVKNINVKDAANLDFVLKVIARYHFLDSHSASSLNYEKLDWVEYSKRNSFLNIARGVDVILDLKSKVTRAEFLSYLLNAIDKKSILEINNISDGVIPDISDNEYKTSIYLAYKYGLICGVDSKGTFIPNRNITYNEIFIIMNRLFNPNLRQAVSLYSGDIIEVQSDVYPMWYKNTTKGLEIIITKERYYQTDCYVANIKMTNPSHLKTIYSDGKWSGVGCEASIFDKRINSIFMVNGDFRNSEYGEKLGIIRNFEVVNNKNFNNVLGMDLEGNLVKIKANNAYAVLEKGIRETWTFGPWLITDGKIVNSDSDARHPRTFIGQVKRDDWVTEYIIVVADGRSVRNAGLTNQEMANILFEKNCYIGYNLDGGGSSVMMFMGKVLNDPCYGERADIDYIYIK